MSAVPLPWMSSESGSDLVSLFESAPLWFAQCSADGTIMALNPALEGLLGPGVRTGRRVQFTDLIHADDRMAGERLLSELFEGRRESVQVDSRSPIDNQVMRWTLWRVEGLDGPGVHALALAEPIQDRQEAEQRLRQAQRLEAVGRLAGGVAHDFNNLLTGMLLYCDLLLAGLEPGHRVRSYGEEIRSAAIQAAGVVGQLLNASRPANLQPRLLSLNQVAEGMRNLLERLAGDRIQLHFQLDSSLGLVRMDHTQAQQILLNLVLNARDAMPEGGRIAIETCNCQVQVLAADSSVPGAVPSLPCALFAVADNGCGMDEHTRAHLFEAFFTTKGGNGTGLGLATVHDIVTSSGGLIHVDSAPGCGTRVRMLLPLVPETAPDPRCSTRQVSGNEESLCNPQKESML